MCIKLISKEISCYIISWNSILYHDIIWITEKLLGTRDVLWCRQCWDGPCKTPLTESSTNAVITYRSTTLLQRVHRHDFFSGNFAKFFQNAVWTLFEPSTGLLFTVCAVQHMRMSYEVLQLYYWYFYRSTTKIAEPVI